MSAHRLRYVGESDRGPLIELSGEALEGDLLPRLADGAMHEVTVRLA